MINFGKRILDVYMLNKKLYQDIVSHKKGKKKVMTGLQNHVITLCSAFNKANVPFSLLCPFCQILELHLPSIFPVPVSLIFSQTTRKSFYHVTYSEKDDFRVDDFCFSEQEAGTFLWSVRKAYHILLELPYHL